MVQENLEYGSAYMFEIQRAQSRRMRDSDKGEGIYIGSVNKRILHNILLFSLNGKIMCHRFDEFEIEEGTLQIRADRSRLVELTNNQEKEFAKNTLRKKGLIK